MAKFADISSVDDLIAYLDDASTRLDKRDYLYHYTRLDCALQIFKGCKWHLSNAKGMNDQLEYKNGDPDRWKNIFFASFMTDTKESIGMWSMYGQPWKDGVLLTLPKKTVSNWIKNVKKLYEISCDNYQPTGRILEIDDENRVILSSVAYTNCDNHENEERLTWSTAKNTNIKSAAHIPKLTGYIKDAAWDYEREIRIKAVLKAGHGFKRVAIDVPDEVLDSMIITAGPLFVGDLEKRLREEVQRELTSTKSLFCDKLKIKNPCDDCRSNNETA